MTAMTQSFYTYLKHTKRYYAPFFSPKSMVLVVVLVVGMGVLAAAANMVVTHAGVAQWLATDVLNETILKGNFDYMLTADAPEESDNRFHLQMPMMLEGFLPASNYVSGGTADPDRPKLRVSPRSTGGEYNPFRVMLNAALSDAELKASGAAQAIAAMDLSTVPLHTDVVTLTIFVEEDVPILYYPTSLAYGSRIPQYAFLWGAIEFQGTNNKDLLVRNSDGGATEVSEQEFAKDGKCDAFVRYLNTALGSIKKADMEIMSALSLLGNSLGTQWTPKILYPQYQAMFKKSATFEADTIARLKSFAFTAKYCINTEPQSGEQLYTTAITYSVTDQLTGRRVYHTKYFILIPGSSTLSESEAAQINRKLSEILEDALGGGMPTVKRRLQLMDISGGN